MFKPKTAAAPVAAAPANDKFLILVVDDEQFIHDFYEELLTKEGYKVITALNGKQGLDLAIQYQPDLILLDIMMPVMDGMMTLAELQKNTVTAKIPVVMLTNAGSVGNMEQARYNSVFAFLIKSNVSPDEVLKVIKQLFLGRKPTSSLKDASTAPPQTAPVQPVTPAPQPAQAPAPAAPAPTAAPVAPPPPPTEPKV